MHVIVMGFTVSEECKDDQPFGQCEILLFCALNQNRNPIVILWNISHVSIFRCILANPNRINKKYQHWT